MSYLSKQEKVFSLLYGGIVSLILLAAVVMQFSGGAFSVPPFSNAVKQEKHDTMALLASTSNSFSRLLRSGRQRNNPQLRSGNMGSASETLFEKSPVDTFFSLEKGPCFSCDGSVNFWIGFIISALPVRAGPLYS